MDISENRKIRLADIPQPGRDFFMPLSYLSQIDVLIITVQHKEDCRQKRGYDRSGLAVFRRAKKNENNTTRGNGRKPDLRELNEA